MHTIVIGGRTTVPADSTTALESVAAVLRQFFSPPKNLPRSVFVRPARCLDNIVAGKVFRHNQPFHHCVLAPQVADMPSSL